MSSIITNQNNLTSTSNSRSEKSKAKKPKTKKSEVAKTDTLDADNVVSSPVEDNTSCAVSNETTSTSTSTDAKCVSVDATVVATADAPVVATADAPNVATADAPNVATADAPVVATADATTPVEVSSPVPNVWQLRQQVKDAAEALEKANKLNAILTAKLNKQSAASRAVAPAAPVTSATPASSPSAAPASTAATAATTDSSDGFTLVQGKHRDNKKPFHKKAESASPTQAPHVSAMSGVALGAKKAYVAKNAYKAPTDEEIARRERRSNAFNLAQDTVVSECIDVFKGKQTDEINTNLQYMTNYRRTLVVKFSSDDVCVEVENEKFVFSRTQFLDNRHFQNKVRGLTDKLVPNAWIRFFPGRDEGTYCIGVQKRKEQSNSNQYAHAT
jgi:hypothetical protein